MLKTIDNNKNSQKPFYSNCLFEAIKFKLKHWKTTRIKVVMYINKYWLHLHFYWQDGQYDYHFHPCNPWRGQLLFKGVIRQHNKNTLKYIITRGAKLKDRLYNNLNTKNSVLEEEINKI